MPDPKIFTLEEANALVPALERLIGRQMLRQVEIERDLSQLAALSGDPPTKLDLDDGDPPEVRARKTVLLERVAAYQEGWREVVALGAIVKDTRTGLVDFYGKVEGRTVWLCWRYGEKRIEYFHELDAGFSARKPLDVPKQKRVLN